MKNDKNELPEEAASYTYAKKHMKYAQELEKLERTREHFQRKGGKLVSEFDYLIDVEELHLYQDFYESLSHEEWEIYFEERKKRKNLEREGRSPSKEELHGTELTRRKFREEERAIYDITPRSIRGDIGTPRERRTIRGFGEPASEPTIGGIERGAPTIGGIGRELPKTIKKIPRE